MNKMTPFGGFYNFIICGYTILSNIILIGQEYLNKDLYMASRKQRSRIREILWIMLTLQLIAFIPFMMKFDIEYIILYMPIFGQIFFIYVFFRMVYSNQLYYDIPVKYATETVKYSNLRINESKVEGLRSRILCLMENEKPYLNMDYTLSEMSKQLDVSANLISMLINSKMNTSFPDFVNSYRINLALELLKDFKKKNLTIETIAYECGFSNRTSFYKAFKKQTGKLPGEYLKKETEKKEVV